MIYRSKGGIVINAPQQRPLEKLKHAVEKRLSPKPQEIETIKDLVWPTHPRFKDLYKAVAGVYALSALYALGTLLPPAAGAAFTVAGGLTFYLYMQNKQREKKSLK